MNTAFALIGAVFVGYLIGFSMAYFVMNRAIMKIVTSVNQLTGTMCQAYQAMNKAVTALATAAQLNSVPIPGAGAEN